jgi:hypothetical protein
MLGFDTVKNRVRRSFKDGVPTLQTHPVKQGITPLEAAGWQKLFQGVRTDDQMTLVIRTTDALEISVEGIARVEDEVILVRGRVAGTADARRVFIIPYDRLSSVYVNRPVAIEEVDLFSPSVSLEEKQRLAQEYAAAQEAVQEAIRQMGKEAGNKETGGDTKSQLDELKRMSQHQQPIIKTGATPVTRSEEAPLNKPQDERLNRPVDKAIAAPATAAADAGPRLALPPVPERRTTGKFTLPERPKSPEGEKTNS